jgi:hypothetical protein
VLALIVGAVIAILIAEHYPEYLPQQDGTLRTGFDLIGDR